ncbi:hypothetical protein BH24CHL4_BH24CHL4_17680 [soil metagenome]
MAAPRSRYTVFLIITLLIAIAPSPVHAQTDEAPPTYIDTMDGETPALLNDESPDPARLFYAYANGQYILQALEPAHTGDLFSYIDAGPFSNSRTAVDAAIAGNQTGKYVFVGCRAGEDHNGYAVQVQPPSGTVSLLRLDPNNPVQLAEENASDLIVPGYELNRIEIECSLDTITGSVNGEVVVSATDDTYELGASYIGAGNVDAFPDVLFAVFDNLEVFDLDATEAGSPVAAESPVAVGPGPHRYARSHGNPGCHRDLRSHRDRCSHGDRGPN